MKQVISSLDWIGELGNTAFDAIDNDIILFEKMPRESRTDYPFKIDVTTVIICLKGKMEGVINLKSYKAESPCFTVILPDQILEHNYISEDFSGLFIVMSKKFTDSLMPSAQDRLPLFLSVQDNPAVPLNEDELTAMVAYFQMLQRIVKLQDHSSRLEVVRHLTLAFFYGAAYQFHPQSENKKKSHQELLVEKFLSLVQSHYKQQRGLDFYADKLFLTPKHLSKVMKESTGKSASDWIDDYVILEAKALLKSTNMTVQQISDELNFSEQSFFGKYFKRVVGLSPREYKGK
ncbi:MAG: helix-turn-helix domain-containing protein [Tannerella sp.]|jgi:AraC-like DNA-binding protein|nr:helix-turn-helix domain-containing protein [Tannerella sp.]